MSITLPKIIKPSQHPSHSIIKKERDLIEASVQNSQQLRDEVQYSKLVRLKKERKKCEQEEQTMNNRLELLRKEEYKIWKRIKDVHRKTNLIKDLKARNQER